MSSKVTNNTKITIKIFQKIWDLVSLKSYIQQLEDKTANQINFGCSRREGGPVTTETD